MSDETWRPVPAYEGVYEVSDLGRVRSLDRTITHANGVAHSVRGRPLATPTAKDGRKYVSLSRHQELTKHFVDDLVAEAFNEANIAHAPIAAIDEPIVAQAITGEVVHVPFHDDDLLCIEANGRPHVVLKPAIEAIGLDYSTQLGKLRGRSWALVGQCPTTGADGKRYQMVTVDVRTFLMLLATVDENRVAPGVRDKLVEYQAEVADAIESYFTRGGAINPRATEEQLASLSRVATARISMLRSAEGLVDRDWLEAKARHELARGLGEEPEVDPERRPLSVGEYLETAGVTGSALRSMAPTFGKRVKALYRTRYGVDPAPVERFIDGALRDVAGYTEQHRPLFDQVYRDLLA